VVSLLLLDEPRAHDDIERKRRDVLHLLKSVMDGFSRGTFGGIQGTSGGIQGTFGGIQGTFGGIQGAIRHLLEAVVESLHCALPHPCILAVAQPGEQHLQV
jgi:hypothetical protein